MVIKNNVPILLIEDNPADVELMRLFLQDAGFRHELWAKSSLLDGLEFLESKPVELVLLDLNLPDSTGFKTLNTFLEKVPNLPVIVITGINNEIVGNQSVKAGAQDYLVKGQFDGKLLGRVIRYSLQRFKVQQKLEETARELDVSKKRFLEAQEMAHFGAWEMDIVSSEMKWTDEVYRMFGFAPGGFSPTLSDYLGFVHKEDRKAVEDFFEESAKDSKRHEMRHRVMLENFNIRYIAIYAKVQMEETGGRILLAGGIQDITERRLSEQLLLEKNIAGKTALMQEEALSELSFHIRTPLSSIVNLLYLLENTPLVPQQDGFVKDLKASVNDLSAAVNNLSNFSVMVSDTVKVEEEEFNLRDFMQSAQNVLQIKADRASLSLMHSVDENLPEKIVCDPKKLTQILYNLLDNAIRYTPEGGKIQVTATTCDLENGKPGLMFTVKDSGIGIAKSRIPELLEADKLLENPEPEGKSKKRSFGIAIVVRLVKTLNGKMEIQSTEGSGTTFTIKMPVKLVRQSKFRMGEAPDAPLKILLVEDHFLNQIATKKVLTTWSNYISVDIAENGYIALERFRESGYDLVLMDIQMPVMNGIDAARKLREFSNVPIIALTANSTKQEQDKCLAIGMNDYLPKPFKPEELQQRIMQLMSLVMN